jgi:hypothetical protein
MKVESPYRCDYCQNIKAATNHWFLRPTLNLEPGIFEIFTWDEVLAEKPGIEHVCGQECASRAMAKWMQEMYNKPRPPVEPPIPERYLG